MSAPARTGETSLALAARLRLEFDGAFALPATVGEDARIVYLAIRVGGDRFALRLSDLAGVHVDRKIAPLPSAAPTLLGIASFRGALTPVHDLRQVLGYPSRGPARWLARLAGSPPVALAFDALEGQLAIARGDAEGAGGGDVARAPVAARAAALTRGVVHAREALWPIVDVGAVRAALGAANANQGPARPAAGK